MNVRQSAPSTARNRDPILKAYADTMPRSGAALEIASGAGEHAVHLARAFPSLRWRPGDPDPEARASIAAWIAHSGLTNIDPPHAIDVTAKGWEAGAGVADAIVCINMIHIAPFAAAEGLFAGAGRLLAPGGRLFLYGPFSRRGAHAAPSNAEFDKSLRSRDPRWGVRDLDREILPLAERAGLALSAVIEMPANNLSVVFERAAAP